MKKFAIVFFAVLFQLVGLAFWIVTSTDYGQAMAASFISELVAFLLYSWLFILLKNAKTILLKFGMISSAALGLVGLVAYFDIRGILW